jgi:hypothetical protein
MKKFDIVTISTFIDWLNNTTFLRSISLIQLHHTFAPAYKEFKNNNHLQLLQGMEYYHIHSSGFTQIAQNITTFPDGSLALCRSINLVPAGIFGANANGICIENVGDFDSGRDIMTSAQSELIPALVKALCEKFNIPKTTNNVVYHHWFDMTTGKRTNGTGNVKSCPGTAFFGGNSVDDCNNNFIPLIQ